MSIEGAAAGATMKFSTVLPPLGGAAVAYWISEVFGPNISVASLVFAIIGCLLYYFTHAGKLHRFDNALVVIVVFLCSACGAIVLAGVSFDLLRKIKGFEDAHRSWVVALSFLYGFFLQMILKAIEAAGRSLSFNRFGLSFGTKHPSPYGTEKQDTEDGPGHARTTPWRSSRYGKSVDNTKEDDAKG